MIVENIFGTFNIKAYLTRRYINTDLLPLETISTSTQILENKMNKKEYTEKEIEENNKKLKFKLTKLSDICINKILNKYHNKGYPDCRIDNIEYKDCKIEEDKYIQRLKEEISLSIAKIDNKEIKRCSICFRLTTTNQDVLTFLKFNRTNKKIPIKIKICSLRCFNRYTYI